MFAKGLANVFMMPLVASSLFCCKSRHWGNSTTLRYCWWLFREVNYICTNMFLTLRNAHSDAFFQLFPRFEEMNCLYWVIVPTSRLIWIFFFSFPLQTYWCSQLPWSKHAPHLQPNLSRYSYDRFHSFSSSVALLSILMTLCFLWEHGLNNFKSCFTIVNCAVQGMMNL